MPPQTDDFAIVVGVSDYPSPTMPQPPLSGPQHDAKNIADWLTSPGGGNLPAINVKIILSADFPPLVLPIDASSAQPSQEIIDRAFRSLRDRVRTNYTSVGQQARRLYVFMAGHGFCRDDESAALLTADGDYDDNINYCIDPKVYVQWFRQEAYFKEVVLWMDCCRDMHANAMLPQLKWPSSLLPPPEMQEARSFYGFAARANAQSRELPLPPPDGPKQGLFTYALLEGLKNAPGDASGNVTGASLAGYVYQVLKRTAGPNKNVQEPYVHVDPVNDIVMFQRPATPEPAVAVPPLPMPTPLSNRYRITFAPPFPPDGVTVQVRDESTQQWMGAYPANLPLPLRHLPVGLCGLRRSDGKTLGFSVLGPDETVQITLNWETEDVTCDRW